MLKTAKKIAESYEILCPECKNTHETANGHLYWSRHDFEGGEVVKCVYCTMSFKMPKP